MAKEKMLCRCKKVLLVCFPFSFFSYFKAKKKKKANKPISKNIKDEEINIKDKEKT